MTLPEGSTIYISHVSNRPVDEEKILQSIMNRHKRRYGNSGFKMAVRLYEYEMYTDPTHKYTHCIKCITNRPLDVFAIIEPDRKLLIDINDILNNVDVISVFSSHRGY